MPCRVHGRRALQLDAYNIHNRQWTAQQHTQHSVGRHHSVTWMTKLQYIYNVWCKAAARVRMPQSVSVADQSSSTQAESNDDRQTTASHHNKRQHSMFTCTLHRWEFPFCHDSADNTTLRPSHVHRRSTPGCVTVHDSINISHTLSAQYMYQCVDIYTVCSSGTVLQLSKAKRSKAVLWETYPQLLQLKWYGWYASPLYMTWPSSMIELQHINSVHVHWQQQT